MSVIDATEPGDLIHVKDKVGLSKLTTAIDAARGVSVWFFFLFIVAGSLMGCGEVEPTTPPPPALAPVSLLDISYGAHPQQALDIYGFDDAGVLRPVVVWVHGGGWVNGDKTNKLDNKRAYFAGLGYVLVSINYRLADPDLAESERPMHPDQVRDVAASVEWVRSHIQDYGGDPQRIVLLGHSAGAHLVSLLGVHADYLKEAVGDVGLGALRGVIAVDSAAYDLTDPSGGLEELATNAFGTDPDIRRDASPLYQVASGRNTPPFLIFARGSSKRVSESEAFFAQVDAADVEDGGDVMTTVSSYNHEEINSAIGDVGEERVTPLISGFLRSVFE